MAWKFLSDRTATAVENYCATTQDETRLINYMIELAALVDPTLAGFSGQTLNIGQAIVEARKISGFKGAVLRQKVRSAERAGGVKKEKGSNKPKRIEQTPIPVLVAPVVPANEPEPIPEHEPERPAVPVTPAANELSTGNTLILGQKRVPKNLSLGD